MCVDGLEKRAFCDGGGRYPCKSNAVGKSFKQAIVSGEVSVKFGPRVRSEGPRLGMIEMRMKPKNCFHRAKIWVNLLWQWHESINITPAEFLQGVYQGVLAKTGMASAEFLGEERYFEFLEASTEIPEPSRGPRVI